MWVNELDQRVLHSVGSSVRLSWQEPKANTLHIPTRSTRDCPSMGRYDDRSQRSTCYKVELPEKGVSIGKLSRSMGLWVCLKRTVLAGNWSGKTYPEDGRHCFLSPALPKSDRSQPNMSSQQACGRNIFISLCSSLWL